MVGPPKVINKRVDDKLLEPFEVKFPLEWPKKTKSNLTSYVHCAFQLVIKTSLQFATPIFHVLDSDCYCGGARGIHGTCSGTSRKKAWANV